MSDDDWRVRVSYPDADRGQDIEWALKAGKIDPDLIGHGVIISNESDEDELFLYAGTRAFAERAEQAVRQAADTLKVEVGTELTHWHPVAEQWEAPDAPLPDTPAALAAEHAEVEAAEREDSAAIGEGAFEVRIGLPSRHEAIELAATLKGEGLDPVRRFRLVILRTADEDAAAALAARLSAGLPEGASITSGASWEETERVVDEIPVPFRLLFTKNEPETL